MILRLIKAFIILPGSVLFFVPLGILVISDNYNIASVNDYTFWLACIIGITGAVLSGWAWTHFIKHSHGTPAPWDPSTKLVVSGPYCYVRNPMITGVIIMLACESLLFNSLPLAAWLIIFTTGNVIYFPLFEEKKLLERFGQDYTEYKMNVPRWIPRLTAWKIG